MTALTVGHFFCVYLAVPSLCPTTLCRRCVRAYKEDDSERSTKGGTLSERQHDTHAHADRPSGAASESFVAVLVLAAFAALAMWPLIGQAGWPYNHEELNFSWRVHILYQHMQLGDVWPVWSSRDTFDFGSPLPAMYHKLFNYVAVAFYALSGSMKTALMLAVGLLLVVGGLGVYAAARYLGLGRLVALALGIAFIFANYTTTNWLLRGAMAELTVLALLPFAFLWMAIFVREGRWAVWIGPLLFLMALSHSVIAYYTVWLLTLAAGVALVRGGFKPVVARAFKPALLSVGIFAVCAALAWAPSVYMAGGFDVTNVTSRGYSPEYQLRPLVQYVWNPGWRWGENWQATHLSVQLDQTALAVMVGALALAVWRERRADGSAPDTKGTMAIALLFLAAMVIMVVMQMPMALPLYDAVWGLKYIQFPWRLLGLITTGVLLTIAAALARVHELGPRMAAPTLALTLVVASIVGHGGFSPIQYPFYTDEELDAPPQGVFFLSGVGEYFPTVEGESVTITHERIKAWSAAGGWGGACRGTEPEPPRGETLARRFVVTCAQDGDEVILPVFFSGAEDVVNASGARLDHYRSARDPRIHVRPGKGGSVLTVHLPTYGRVLGRLLGEPPI